MADQEEEDLRMAMRMSMQHSPPEPKRSKPRDVATSAGAMAESTEELPEVKSRRLQRELMAAAAEKRMLVSKSAYAAGTPPSGAYSAGTAPSGSKVERSVGIVKKEKELGPKDGNLGRELSEEEANQLFSMVFGSGVSKDILAQWTNQGIRYYNDVACVLRKIFLDAKASHLSSTIPPTLPWYVKEPVQSSEGLTC